MPKKPGKSKKKKRKKAAEEKPAGKRRTTKTPGQKKGQTAMGEPRKIGLFPFASQFEEARKDLARFANKSFPINIFKVAPGRQIDFFVHKGLTIAVRPHPTQPNRFVISAVKDFTKERVTELNLAKIEGAFYHYKDRRFLRVVKVEPV